MSYEQIDHQAASFIALLWRDLYNRIRELMHPHRHEHEPGGKDQVHLPLGFLTDVTLTSPSDGEVLTYDLATTAWINGAGGGGGAHQAHLGIPLPASVVPPGPTNITGAAYTVTAVRIASDGDVYGTVSGCGTYSFGFGASGGVQDYGSNPGSPLSATWGNGSTITIGSLTYGSAASASYLTVDIALQG